MQTSGDPTPLIYWLTDSEVNMPVRANGLTKLYYKPAILQLTYLSFFQRAQKKCQLTCISVANLCPSRFHYIIISSPTNRGTCARQWTLTIACELLMGACRSNCSQHAKLTSNASRSGDCSWWFWISSKEWVSNYITQELPLDGYRPAGKFLATHPNQGYTNLFIGTEIKLVVQAGATKIIGECSEPLTVDVSWDFIYI